MKLLAPLEAKDSTQSIKQSVGWVEIRAAKSEQEIRKPADPTASKDDVRLATSFCVDHLCGCT